MKTILSLLVTVTFALALDAAPSRPAYVRINKLPSAIQRGTDKSVVLLDLGLPDHRLSPDLWAYEGARLRGTLQLPADCRTLVISFFHDEVQGMRLVNKAALDVIVSASRTDGQATAVADHGMSQTAGPPKE